MRKVIIVEWKGEMLAACDLKYICPKKQWDKMTSEQQDKLVEFTVDEEILSKTGKVN